MRIWGNATSGVLMEEFVMLRKTFLLSILFAQFAFCEKSIYESFESYYKREDVSVISNEYAEMSDSLTMQLEELLNSTALEARSRLHDIGYIRASRSLPCLLKNMGYDRDVRNNYTNDNTLFDLGPPKYVANQLLWHPHTRYPVVGAILFIGVKFEAFTRHMALYPPSNGRNQSFADIGKASSGEYFQKYIGKRPDIDDDSRKAIIAAIDRKLPFDLMNHALSFEVQRKYDAMWRVLWSRFSNELAKASSNIDDTISTMGFIRMLDAIPILADNLTICPQTSTNATGGYVFPAAEALISIGPAIGDCFDRLKATKPLSLEESLWLRISHELYPEGLEYELFSAAATNDTRAARMLRSLPWRRLTDDDCRPLSWQSP